MQQVGSPTLDHRSGRANLCGERSQSARARPAVVLVCDPRPLTLYCLNHALQADWKDATLFPVSDPRHFIESENEWPALDIAVLNSVGRSVLSAGILDTIDLIRARLNIPIAVISDEDDAHVVSEALKRGARAYINTACDMAILVNILNLVCAGGTYVSSTAFFAPDDPNKTPGPNQCETYPTADNSMRREIVETFTPREIEILRRLKDGKPNKIIAYELDICESTVKVHMRHIMGKLSATNRTQAALLARQMFEEGN